MFRLRRLEEALLFFLVVQAPPGSFMAVSNEVFRLPVVAFFRCNEQLGANRH